MNLTLAELQRMSKPRKRYWVTTVRLGKGKSLYSLEFTVTLYLTQQEAKDRALELAKENIASFDEWDVERVTNYDLHRPG